MIQSAQRPCRPWIWGLFSIALLAAPVAASGQTRDYNPIRRTAATEEQATPQPKTAARPATAPTEAWPSPAISGPPNQWRSVRPSGPVQLPAPRYLPSRTQAQVSPMDGSSAPEEIPSEVAPGEWQDGSPWQGPAGPGPGPACHGPDCGGCGDCDNCCTGGSGRGFGLCGGACGSNCGSCLGNLRWALPQSIQLFGGVHGFKGPPDRGNNGNFGFHEGFNIGGMLKPACGIGYQFGGQFVHSNLSGDTTVATRTADRDQSFFTAGLFRKVPCGCGLQGGIVWDMLYDDYYVEMELAQVRGEVSFLGPCAHEFGFAFAARVEDDRDTLFGFQEIWDPTDQYLFFYRRPFGCGGQYRVWAGFTDDSDGLLGGELSVPLSTCWALATNFNYLIPEQNGVESIPEEAWALGITLVWYPGGGANCNSPCRPLFGVADNATFLVDRRQGPQID